MKSRDEPDYHALLSRDGAYGNDDLPDDLTRRRAWGISNLKLRLLVFGLCVSGALNALLFVKYLLNARYDPSQQLYSPAMSEIRYKVHKFNLGFGATDVPIYEQPPSSEVDKAWAGLYANYIPTRISRTEAEKSVNKTVHAGRIEGYMVVLDVFHQLHCLDLIRKALHPHDYPDLDLPPGHMRHCVGVLRQGTMCASDITPNVWQWSNKVNRVASRTDVLHTCRDFEKLKLWASERRIYEEELREEDFKVNLVDDLQVKGYL